ncbi:MAG: hypothetical protein KIT31_28325 [Deltaproteobacteria bacterium]|nr:hypothetical protein [Deltaproteobacteria bacterium]
MRWLPLVATAMAILAGACGEDACDPAAEACTIEGVVSTIEIAAGVEDEDTCQSWTLNNPTELWVNGITQRNDGAYHHANWFFVPDNLFNFPDGTWSCSQAEFSELTAALLGGYLFALSTQSLEEAQALPAGSAIRIPPFSRVIGSSHFLNGSDAPIKTTMRLTLHTLPLAQVTAKMAPARITYHDLHLDASRRSSFTTECLLDDAHMQRVGEPLQYELHYVLSHYHQLGAYTRVEIAGGPRDGEVLAEHLGYGENFGQPVPFIDLGQIGARGLRFTCGFQNPRDVSVGWGIGDQEMCVVALQARTNLAFDGFVSDGTSAQVGVSPDGEVQYQGTCSLNAFPWDFDKGGGPPR